MLAYSQYLNNNNGKRFDNHATNKDNHMVLKHLTFSFKYWLVKSTDGFSFQQSCPTSYVLCIQLRGLHII